MHDTRGMRRAALVGALILCGSVSVVSFIQARKLDFDFHHFYRDASYVWEHAALNPDRDNSDPLERRQLPFYLPVVPLMLSPIAAAGVQGAAMIWSLAHGASLFISLFILCRWAGERASDGIAIVTVACLVALPAFYEAARFSQISFIVLALLLLGNVARERGRYGVCGVLFGLATVLKLLPGLILIWLALKRQWTALFAAVICIVIVAFLPCLVVFGPQRAAAYHREWLADNVSGHARRALIDSAERPHFIDHRNQSIAAVVGRVFQTEHPAAAPWQPLAIGQTGRTAISVGTAVVLGLALVLMTRRPAAVLARIGLRAEFAACLTAMIVFSPLLRQYYLVWCLPALALSAEFGRAADASRVRILGRVALSVWLVGMALWLWPTARVYGAHLAMVAAIALLMAAAGADRGMDVRGPPCVSLDNRQNHGASSPCGGPRERRKPRTKRMTVA